ncbi:MAG: four helix bundle protein [Bacteroidetes bacterium]|nr:four helix bundle protein [Bacteroidota bacterium]MBP7398376.1 four helix bundle protein [Chitinophagales bacterium]MBK7108797.1 four helix bundle protein [Bacteroidota bacterium]MBK8488878.1 four helix bundle protein [Bacteroidota bacterium]MBP8754609.1 four helix bundle protein [Chitinophagales bacterium]
MFLELNHRNLDAYKFTRKFVSDCYKLTSHFPPEERYHLTSQIRRAAISVHLNLSEGSSRKSLAERKRFFEISRSSIIEIDAGLDLAMDLGYFNPDNFGDFKESIINCFKYLKGLINSSS